MRKNPRLQSHRRTNLSTPTKLNSSVGTLQRIILVPQKRRQYLPRPLCREAPLKVTTRRAGGVEGSDWKVSQLVNAAAACSDAKLNGMVMTPNKNPDDYLTEVFQQRDELGYTGESFTEARIFDLILEALSDEYEPIRFSAEWYPENSLNKEIETTICNLYAYRCSRRGTSSSTPLKVSQRRASWILSWRVSATSVSSSYSPPSGISRTC